MKTLRLIPLFLVMLLSLTVSLQAQSLVTGQSIYLPLYSSIYYADRSREFHLTVTISVRNPNMVNPVRIHSIMYYDTAGNMRKKLLSEARVLRPMESISVVINESDFPSDVGASCIIVWSAGVPVDPLLCEAVMIGTRGQQGISFITRGVPITPPR